MQWDKIKRFLMACAFLLVGLHAFAGERLELEPPLAGSHSLMDVSLGVGPTSVALAAWYTLPIVSPGLLTTTHDALSLEFGGFAYAHRSEGLAGRPQTVYGISPSLGGRWDVQIAPLWTFFTTAKLGIALGKSLNDNWLLPALSLGGLYRLSSRLHLRMELGYPMGLSAGLSFPVGGV